MLGRQGLVKDITNAFISDDNQVSRMTRIQKCKNIIYGVGALGGTVAVFATVLETFYGDNHKMSLQCPQLS